MTDPISYSTAFVIGLLGGAHCIGMCGGIMNALSFAIPAEQRNSFTLNIILLAYNSGRIFSYMLAGAIIGGLGWLLQSTLEPVTYLLRIFAGGMLILMGLYIAGWWMGLSKLERMGNTLWLKIEPLGKNLMPVTKPSKAILLGALWGWLPCGMVYSVLTWSASSGDWLQSSLIMLSFGLGTLPVMFVTGRFALVLKSFIQKTSTRKVAAALMIVFGIWTILGANPHHVKNGHGHSDHSMPVTHHEHSM